MLDFDRLRTPEAGQVLVEPDARTWLDVLQWNRGIAHGWRGTIGGVDIAEARQLTRRAVLGEGVDEKPVVVTGHQPGFFHAGVWAKHVMARRLADAADGIPVNLIVDNDAPKAAYVEVPTIDAADGDGPGLRVERVRFADAVAGVAFEEIGPWSADDIDAFEARLRALMGDRFDASMVPVYLAGVRSAIDADDWVTQTVAGRKAIDCAMGVCLTERRVSACWGGPLLAEMVANANRFVAAYNDALAAYRVEQGITGHDRPIPDLIMVGSRLELPVWVYRAGEVRRRLFVELQSGRVRLWGGHEPLGTVEDADVVRLADDAFLAERFADVRFRPRALTLTLWARLLLADLFIHGIGGAKYDRITDRLIEGYFGWAAPEMACVSATLHLDVPSPSVTEQDVREARRRVRDFRYNPQRHVSSGGSASEGGELARMNSARESAVAESKRLRAQSPDDHTARRRVFERIRSLNKQLTEAASDVRRRLESDYETKRRGLADRRIADGREYWFALLGRESLGQMTSELPILDKMACGEHQPHRADE